MAFAENLNHLMEINEMTNYRLAQLLGASQTSVSNWREGKNIPHKKTLISIAQLFEISLSDLTGDAFPNAILPKNKVEKPASSEAGGREYSDYELLKAFNAADESTKEVIRLLLKLK